MVQDSYTYAMRITEQTIYVEKRDAQDTLIGQPSGPSGYHGAVRVRIQALQQAATRDKILVDEVRALGELLAAVLFQPVLRRDFLNTYEQARSAGAFLRLELDVDERILPEVAALPWEWLTLPSSDDHGAIWLGTNPNMVIVRRRSQWLQPHLIPLAPGERLRLALVVAAPGALGPVKYERILEMFHTLARTQSNRFALLEPVIVASPSQIDAILEQRPHLLHFIGHGRMRNEQQQEIGEVAFCDDLSSDDPIWIEAERFSELFHRHRPNVVVLQTCESGALSPGRAFVGVASQIVQQHIPIVVAMQYNLSNATAQRFMSTFYTRLVRGDAVDSAVQEGRRSIALGPDGYSTRDFATPVVFMSVKDGHLFQSAETERPVTFQDNSSSKERPIQQAPFPRNAERHVEVRATNGGQAGYSENGNIQQTSYGQSMGEQKRARHQALRSEERTLPSVGLLTALPIEHAAMEVLLEKARPYVVPGERTNHRYTLGEIPLANGGRLHVVLALLSSAGLTLATARATRLLEHFSSVQELIMVGIAGGAPHPEKPGEHVRLGDIVVSDQYGTVQYDFVKRTIDETIYRPLPQRPSANLLLHARYLEAGQLKGERPWLPVIQQAMTRLQIDRPPETTDILDSFATQPPSRLTHPIDWQRRANEPRVFFSPIASSNTLLRDPVLRDALRDHFGVKAIEMEGSGVADASWEPKAGYLVVRGICDYCDPNKNDLWHPYAAVVAAAYTRVLLASLPDLGDE